MIRTDSQKGNEDEPQTSTESASGSGQIQPSSVEDIGSLVSEWFGSHSAFLKQASKLILADARLAAVSGIQLGALAIAFSLVFVCTWIVCSAAIAVFLMWLGVSLGASILGVLTLHILILLILYLSIRSTYEGLRFKASRESLSRATQDFKADNDEIANNS